MLRLQIESKGETAATLLLPPGRHTVGSGGGDRVRVGDLPAAGALLEVAAESIILQAGASTICLGDRALSTGERRLVRDGDVLKCGESTVRFALASARASDATAVNALQLLNAEVHGAAQLAQPCLVWLNGRDCGKRLLVDEGATFVGRGEGAVAQVRDPLASKAHAKLVLSASGASICDLASTNGLFVDGARVDGSRALLGREILRIGDTEIVFEAASVLTSPDLAPTAPEEAQLTAPAPVSHSPRSPHRRRPSARAVEVAVVALAGSGALTALGAAVWLAVR